MNRETTVTGMLSADGISDITAPPAPPPSAAGIMLPVFTGLLAMLCLALLIRYLRPGPVRHCLRVQQRRLMACAPVRDCLHEAGRKLSMHGLANHPLVDELQHMRFAAREPDRRHALELLARIEASLRRRS